MWPPNDGASPAGQQRAREATAGRHPDEPGGRKSMAAAPAASCGGWAAGHGMGEPRGPARQHPRREGDRPVQARKHTPGRPVAGPRGRRTCHAGVGGLAQHPAAVRTTPRWVLSRVGAQYCKAHRGRARCGPGCPGPDRGWLRTACRRSTGGGNGLTWEPTEVAMATSCRQGRAPSIVPDNWWPPGLGRNPT